MTVNDFLPLLLDALLKAGVILLLVTMLHGVLAKATAATKHLLWTIALCACLSLPVLTAILPVWRVPLLPAVAAPMVTTVAPSIETKYAPQWESLSLEASPAPVVKPSVNWAAWLLAIWLLGAWLVAARIIVGFVSVGLIRRHAQLLQHEAWRALVIEAATALRLKQHVRLCLSEQVDVPMTTGIVRPVVLLPAAALQWSRTQLQAVLLHELAHIKRRDCLTQMLTNVACVLYWCNPLVWVAAHQMRHTREQACDDEVLAAGTRASDYASCLVDVAKSATTGKYASPVAVGMACSQLGERVTAILNPSRNRRKITWRICMLMVLLISTLVVPLAAFQPSSPVAIAAAPTPLPDLAVQEQDAKKQQREVEKHLREIEKHRREISEVHQREIEKHLRELEKLRNTMMTEAQRAQLIAEIERAAAADQATRQAAAARLREQIAQELAQQKQALVDELRQRTSQETQRQVTEQIERTLREVQVSTLMAQEEASLMEMRARLRADLEQLQQRYTDKHPDVIEQKARLAAAAELLQRLERKQMSPPQLQLEVKLAELETQLKTIQRQYTDKHPKVQDVKAQIEALRKELERSLRK